MGFFSCNCKGDPVARAAAIVVPSITENLGRVEEERTLRAAQRALIESVCTTCWPDGLNTIRWVNTYVETAAKLDKMGDSAQEENPGTWEEAALFAPVGIDGLSDEDVHRFHRTTLLPALLNVAGDLQLTQVLAQANTPPIVRVWMEGDSFKSDNVLAIPNEYKCLFDYGGNNGVYAHVASPLRGSVTGTHKLTAGSYLFLRSQHSFSAVPPCLIQHLRAFVQSLVAAQLWALSERRQRKVAMQYRRSLDEQTILRAGAGAADRLFMVFHEHMLPAVRDLRLSLQSSTSIFDRITSVDSDELTHTAGFTVARFRCGQEVVCIHSGPVPRHWYSYLLWRLLPRSREMASDIPLPTREQIAGMTAEDFDSAVVAAVRHYVPQDRVQELLLAPYGEQFESDVARTTADWILKQQEEDRAPLFDALIARIWEISPAKTIRSAGAPWTPQHRGPSRLWKCLPRRQKPYAKLLAAIAALSADDGVASVDVVDKGVDLHLTFEVNGDDLERLTALSLVGDEERADAFRRRAAQGRGDFRLKVERVMLEGGLFHAVGTSATVRVAP